MQPTHHTFTQLLIGRGSATQPSAYIHADWDSLIGLARRANLLSLLHYQIGQAGIPLSDGLQQKLRDEVRQATLHALQKRAELTSVLERLNRAGILPILFKGAVLAHTVYPSYALRSMGDIDLWISREQMPAARDTVESLGYVYTEKAERAHAMQALGDGELQMRRQTPVPSLVELHYGVFAGEWMRIGATIDRAGVRDRLLPITICNQPALRLADEDTFIQIALHMGINHQMTTNPLRSLVDLEFLARRGPDWAVIAQRCREWHVYTAVSAVIHLWHQLFATSNSAQAAAALPFSRVHLLGLFVGPQDLIEGHRLGESRWRLPYQLFLIDRGRDARKLLTHTLWPDDAWLLARYHEIHPGTRLRHLRQLLRGKV